MTIFTKSNPYKLAILHVFGCLLYIQGYAQSVHYQPSARPDRIIRNINTDERTQIALNWRTDTGITENYLEIVEAGADQSVLKKAVRIKALTTPFSFDTIRANYHSVTAKGLKAGTRYAYRVGCDSAWSEWFQGKTTEEKEQFSFVYFGDVQNGIRTHWSRVMRQAFAHLPSADLMMFAGDNVNRGNNDNEWGELFEAGGYMFAQIPMMLTNGNHEYPTMVKGQRAILSRFWEPQFNQPLNGPADTALSETCFFADMNNIRFISLNSMEFLRNETLRGLQLRWLDTVLSNNPNGWTVLIMHHPVYSPAKDRDNPLLKKFLQPVLDKYAVDLVLQGHDHTYARAKDKILMANGKPSGTTYVVSVSGSKMYELNPQSWMDRSTADMQLYQLITIKKNKLQYASFTADGACFDAFELNKKTGRANKLVEIDPKTNNAKF